MFLPQTRKVLTTLRAMSARVRSNNKKIDTWVDEYVQSCLVRGEDIQILTQWCLSKNLETRWKAQGNRFLPLQSEQRLVLETIPEIIRTFSDNGLRVSWWFTLNAAFVDGGRIAPEVFREYFNLVQGLIDQSPALQNNAILIDWEADVLAGRQQPNEEVLADPFRFISKGAFEVDMGYLMRRVAKYPDFSKTRDELEAERIYEIACSVAEGQFLTGKSSPFPGGRFILVPLEFPERYVFFEARAPGFDRRIAAIVKPYPWRMDANDLVYEP